MMLFAIKFTRETIRKASKTVQFTSTADAQRELLPLLLLDGLAGIALGFFILFVIFSIFIFFIFFSATSDYLMYIFGATIGFITGVALRLFTARRLSKLRHERHGIIAFK